MGEPTPRLIDGPATAPATLLLAHGAGAGMDSPFMAAVATGVAQRGWRVVRFAFPYMAHIALTGQRRPPDRLPKLLEAFRQQKALALAEHPNRPLFIGGKSLGGRVASLLADELPAVSGCLCLGYPFHPPGRPEQLRTEHLQQLRTPTLILQGERDSFGKRGEVDSYPLSQAIEVEWIAAGDHSFKPNRSSACSEADNWQTAAEACDRFMRAQLSHKT